MLTHEDILAHIYTENISKNGVFKTFIDGSVFKASEFCYSNEHVLEKCLYHDHFSLVSPIGNKTQKHKIPTFYFVLGNLVAKLKSRIRDIHVQSCS